MIQQFSNIKAFVSCSIRNEDMPFINFIECILRFNGITPFGTVGRHSAAPINPAEHIRQNVHLADIVVIVATPRFIQKDIQSGKIVYGLPEMIHVEAGIAFMSNKPVIVFVQEGTDVGGFIPNITQYIILNGSVNDFNNKQLLIKNLFTKAQQIVLEAKERAKSVATENLFIKGFAIFGGLVAAEKIFADNTTTRKRKYTKRKRY